MDAFSGVGLSVIVTFISALTKPSTTEKALDNRSKEVSKKLEKRNATSTKMTL